MARKTRTKKQQQKGYTHATDGGAPCEGKGKIVHLVCKTCLFPFCFGVERTGLLRLLLHRTEGVSKAYYPVFFPFFPFFCLSGRGSGEERRESGLMGLVFLKPDNRRAYTQNRRQNP